MHVMRVDAPVIARAEPGNLSSLIPEYLSGCRNPYSAVWALTCPISLAGPSLSVIVEFRLSVHAHDSVGAGTAKEFDRR